MPRTKVTSTRRETYPERLQDGTGLPQRIVNTIIGEFVSPLSVRVETLEGEVDGLVERQVLQTATVELAHGRRGGVAYIEPAGGFAEDAVGKPALVVQGPSGDADEGGIVLFTGLVLSRRQMRLHWSCGFPAPARLPVLYLIA